MIQLPGRLLDEIAAHARREAPKEVRGWLAGRGATVEKTYPVPNVADKPQSRFEMEPEAQLAAMREVRELDLDLVGTYHSHPRSAARPSKRILLANSVRPVGCGRVSLILRLNADFLGQFWVQMLADETVSDSLLNSPAVSKRDEKLALYPDLAHLIVSLAGSEPEFRCYRIMDSKVVEMVVEGGGGLV